MKTEIYNVEGIEIEFERTSKDDAREVVGQIASVAAQPRAVAHDAFGVKSYFHVVGVKAVEATRRGVCRCCP